MANHTKNDRWETVIVSGAPGSRARMLCLWPDLIERLNAIHQKGVGQDGVYVPGADRDEAVEAIRAVGIMTAMETDSLLAVSDYGKSFEDWKHKNGI